jgi:hypothetical protein
MDPSSGFNKADVAASHLLAESTGNALHTP